MPSHLWRTPTPFILVTHLYLWLAGASRCEGRGSERRAQRPPCSLQDARQAKLASFGLPCRHGGLERRLLPETLLVLWRTATFRFRSTPVFDGKMATRAASTTIN